MRIIAGEFRGRPIHPPASDVTRPITDRVKQSLFDILTPYVDGARVYDCFSGTGSMGLESLSRGAVHATFFEQDRSARQLLEKNIQTLGTADRCTVVAGSLFDYFERPSKPETRVDLVFFDPPYRLIRESPTQIQRTTAVLANDHLQAAGLLILRHDAVDSIALESMHKVDERTYGGMTLAFYARQRTDDSSVSINA